jgi:hypothetical protein
VASSKPPAANPVSKPLVTFSNEAPKRAIRLED